MSDILIVILSGLLGVLCSTIYFYSRYRSMKMEQRRFSGEVDRLENEFLAELSKINIMELQKTDAGRNLLKLLPDQKIFWHKAETLVYKTASRTLQTYPRIKVVGVGGAGVNVVNWMINCGLQGVEFIAVNTDTQSLWQSGADIRLQIGKKTTSGYGANDNPEIGRRAAEESISDLRQVLKGGDLIFVTAGMGGGTGTGAAPIVARVAKESGSLVIGNVTLPFTFEGTRRLQVAEMGINMLRESTNTLIVFPNDRLLQLFDRRTSLQDAFRLSNEMLLGGVRGISELITSEGLIYLDFADVRAILSDGGPAMISVGEAEGEDAARKAAEQATSNQLLDMTIYGAHGILFNITGGPGLTLYDVNVAAAIIRGAAHPDVNFIFGAVIDPHMKDMVRITVIATGFEFTIPAINPLMREGVTTPQLLEDKTAKKITPK